jgi:hypothetical protein
MFSKKPMEPVEEADTEIWTCSSPECNGWMRSDFAFEREPLCPLCSSGMHQESRMLPVLYNNARRAVFN